MSLISEYIQKGCITVRPFIVLFGILILPFSVQASEKIEQAFESEGRPVTFVGFKGHQTSYPFIIDSAASRTVIYRSLVAELDMTALPFRSSSVMTATGNREMSLYNLGDIHAFGLDFTIDETVALPGANTSGIYGLVGVDLLKGRVLLTEVGKDPSLLQNLGGLKGEGWSSVQGRRVAYGSIAVDVTIDGRTLPAIIDTGASVSILNSAAALLFDSSSTAVEGREPAEVIASDVIIPGNRVFTRNLHLGEVTVELTSIVSAPLPIFTVFGAGKSPAMILGMDILGRYDIALDFRGWDLWIRSQ